MAQFQTQVPHPLTDQLPDLLTGGSMADPAVGVLLLVFISERCFKGATMQIQFDNVGSGERLLREAGQEEFKDETSTRDPNGALLWACWMGRHHHSAGDALRSYRNSRKVVERARDATLRVGQVVIGRQRKPGLDLGLLEEMIRFAAHHTRQTSEIGEDRSGPILTIQT